MRCLVGAGGGSLPAPRLERREWRRLLQCCSCRRLLRSVRWSQVADLPRHLHATNEHSPPATRARRISVQALPPDHQHIRLGLVDAYRAGVRSLDHGSRVRSGVPGEHVDAFQRPKHVRRRCWARIPSWRVPLLPVAQRVRASAADLRPVESGQGSTPVALARSCGTRARVFKADLNALRLSRGRSA